MSARYYCLLLDMDGTLMDFKASEKEAVCATLEQFGLPSDEQTAVRFSEINDALWKALERGEVKKDKIATQRFAILLEELNLEGDIAKISAEYLKRLGNSAVLYPGVEELLAELAEFATLAVVSNGNQRVQMSRLEKSGLLPYFDGVFVSEKLGVTKPAAKFFSLTLKQLGVKNKEKVLVIGDSLTADIKGGINAKLDTCWCNFENTENDTGIEPTYMVRDYQQLKLVAIGEEALKLAEGREKRHMV